MTNEFMTAKKAIKANRFFRIFIRLGFWSLFHFFCPFWPLFYFLGFIFLYGSLMYFSFSDLAVTQLNIDDTTYKTMKQNNNFAM